MYNNNQTELERYLLESKVKIEYQEENNFLKIILKKDIDIITPGLNLVLNNPYEIRVERIIYYEQ